mgnify:CR=1 FL=1
MPNVSTVFSSDHGLNLPTITDASSLEGFSDQSTFIQSCVYVEP